MSPSSAPRLPNMCSPRATQEKYSAPRGRGAASLSAAEHARQVLARAFGVAPAEDDLVARLDRLADGEQLGARVDSHQVAHHVVAGVGARHRQADQYSPRPDQLLVGRAEQHLERRPAVEGRDDVLLAGGDAVARAKGRAALGEARRHRHLRRQRDAGQPAGDHLVRDLHRARARARDAADDVAARHLRRHVCDQPGTSGACGSACTTAKCAGSFFKGVLPEKI